MLVKIGDKWMDANLVTGLEYSCCNVYQGDFGYTLLVRDGRRDCLCGDYRTEEDVIKAMDEAAEKLNAAQDVKPAKPNGKVTMKHMVYNGDDGDNIYCCTHCKMWMQAYKWFKYCPNCGGEIKGWE